MKALVVDDDLTTRTVLQEILSPYADVHTSVDGAKAVEVCTRALAEGKPYDLICLDMMMPVMTGLEALKLIRREEECRGFGGTRRAKVIIATASDDADSIRQAFQELCDAYIVKPVDAAELLNLMYCLCPIEERSR